PFIPLWEKEWVIPFALAGLLFPNIRRFLSLRRYQSELNALVARTDDEIWRMDLAYLTDEFAERIAGGAAPVETRGALQARLDGTPEGSPPAEAPKPRVREGGR